MAKRVCALKASPQFRPWFRHLGPHNSPPKWPKAHFQSLVGLFIRCFFLTVNEPWGEHPGLRDTRGRLFMGLVKGV